MRLALVALCCTLAKAMVSSRPAGVAAARPVGLGGSTRPAVARVPRVVLQQEDGYDTSAQQFDLLSLRTFRRDTIVQYDATNQSEPLRIALTLFGVLFSLSIPALAGELRRRQRPE